jgi:Peptidase_C39 like family
MTMTLWIDTDKDETIDLGNTLDCLKAFGDMEKAADDAWLKDYADLAGVVSQCMDQEDVDPAWMADVRQQAKRFLAEHDSIGEEAKSILLELAGPERNAVTVKPVRYLFTGFEDKPMIYAAAYRGENAPPSFTPLGEDKAVDRFVAWMRTQDDAPEVQQMAIDGSTNPVGSYPDVERYAHQLAGALGRVTDEGVGKELKAIGHAMLAACNGAEGVALTSRPETPQRNAADKSRVVMLPPGVSQETAERVLAATDRPSRNAAEPPLDTHGILDVPEARQLKNFDCGSACTRSVAEFFGVAGERTEEDFIEQLGSDPEEGTRPEAIIGWFRERGLDVRAEVGMTLDGLRACVEQGRVVIVPVQDYGTKAEFREDQAGHYVIVCGFVPGFVVIQDPMAANAEAGGPLPEHLPDSIQDFGKLMVKESVFDEVWHDTSATGKVLVRFGIAVGRG